MPGRGRGHGRLGGPGPSSGPKLGLGQGPSGVVDKFKPVPFYTNQFGKISKEQYDKNKLDPNLHPDDCGLGEFYVGSLPWHVRNQGRIWIPREDRPNTIPLRTKVKKESKTLKLPENEATVARDFDVVCDELEASSIVLSLLLWNEYVEHKNDPVDPTKYRANFFLSDLRPNFPPFPKNGNPFSLLPTTTSGIFPFDKYGSTLFDSATINRWKNDPKAKHELLEVQIRQLIILYKLDKVPRIYAEQADEGSYGVQTPVFTGDRSNKIGSDQDKKSGSHSKAVEPDSGFYSIEPEIDPWGGNSDTLPPNEYSWEPVTGSGFVSLDDFVPNASYVHTQV